jgi:hypothetical protein
VFDDPATVASYAFAFRIGERIAISLVVIAVAMVVTLGFWRTIQKVDFTLSQEKLSGGGSFVLATPVFALLALIGFAWVSFSHPVSVALPAAGATQAAAAGPVSMMGAAPARPEADVGFRRGEATGQIRSLNCIAGKASGVAERDVDALARVKLGLMLPVWDPGWGEAEAFRRWVLGLSADAPPPAARAVFEASHPLC